MSRKGNPPASLRWYLDSQDVSHLANQTNQTDVEKRGTWQALSVFDYTFVKADNRRELKCVAYHGAYEEGPGTGGPGHRDVAVTLDVMCEWQALSRVLFRQYYEAINILRRSWTLKV